MDGQARWLTWEFASRCTSNCLWMSDPHSSDTTLVSYRRTGSSCARQRLLYPVPVVPSAVSRTPTRRVTNTPADTRLRKTPCSFRYAKCPHGSAPVVTWVPPETLPRNRSVADIQHKSSTHLVEDRTPFIRRPQLHLFIAQPDMTTLLAFLLSLLVSPAEETLHHTHMMHDQM